MMTRNHIRFCALGLFGLMTLAVLGGCSSTSTWATRRNTSPEADTLAYSVDQRKNVHAYTVDVNFRELGDDLDNFFFLDRPKRMSSYPIP